MFKRSEVFSVYPNHPTATNLSMAAGGVRLLSWLTLAAAVVTTLLILIPARPDTLLCRSVPRDVLHL